MAKKKENKEGLIILSNLEQGEVPFEKDHAESILAWDLKHNKTTWTLHDSKLTFKDGKIITGTSEATSNSAGE